MLFKNTLVMDFLGRIFLRLEFAFMFYIATVSQECLRFFSVYRVEEGNGVKIVWMSVQLLNKVLVTSSYF